MPLFFIFIIVPLVELMLLIEVGKVIGSGWTFLIIIATAIAGTKLVKQQGFQTWNKIQTELASGQLPAQAMFDGICILVSGVLLITPGFLTDILGLLLLTPPFRSVAYKQVGHRIKVQGAYTQNFHHSQNGFEQNDFEKRGQSNDEQSPLGRDRNPSSNVIDGEYERKD